MASDRLATSTVARSEGELATYLSDLAAQLHGPRRRREAILTELRDGLDQATKDHIASRATSRPGRRGSDHPVRKRTRRRGARSPANWPPRTPAAPSPASSPPARSWESGGCSCLIQALGAPA